MAGPWKRGLRSATPGFAVLFLVAVALTSHTAALALPSEVTVTWDPARAKATCGATPCAGVPLRAGQLLVVTVKPALPGLFDYSATAEDQTTQSVPPGRLPWPAPKAKAAAASSEGAPEVPAVLGCSKRVGKDEVKAYDSLYVLDADAEKRVQADFKRLGIKAPRLEVLPEATRVLVPNLGEATADCGADRDKNGDVLITGLLSSSGAAEKVHPALAAYAALVASAEKLEDALTQHDVASLESLVSGALDAEGSLHRELRVPLGGPVEALAAALVSAGVVDSSAKADMTTRLEALRTLLHVLPRKAGEVVLVVKELGNQDYTLRLKAEPTSKLPGGVKRTALLRVSLKGRWSYSLTSGVMFSGLVNDEYSLKTVVDERNPDGTVKRSHKELVEESSDRLSTEAALLGALFPIRDSWASNLGIVLGLGLDSDSAARYYGGVGYRLGRVGLVALGVATGKVKTLKESVNVKDSGDTQPGDAVRDKRTTAFFVGLSFGFGE